MQIARYKGQGRRRTLEISTVSVEIGILAIRPYETAISWPRRYKHNLGDWTIVAAYDTEEQAKAGHDFWVQIMLNTPPDQLVDCCNFVYLAMGKELGIAPEEALITRKRNTESV